MRNLFLFFFDGTLSLIVVQRMYQTWNIESQDEFWRSRMKILIPRRQGHDSRENLEEQINKNASINNNETITTMVIPEGEDPITTKCGGAT